MTMTKVYCHVKPLALTTATVSHWIGTRSPHLKWGICGWKQQRPPLKAKYHPWIGNQYSIPPTLALKLIHGKTVPLYMLNQNYVYNGILQYCKGLHPTFIRNYTK